MDAAGCSRKARRRSTPIVSLLVLASALASAANSVPWGLDRIDQRTLPLDGRFDRTGDGAGVRAYVIDTGVRKSHHDFGGRAEWVGDFTIVDSTRPGEPGASDAGD